MNTLPHDQIAKQILQELYLQAGGKTELNDPDDSPGSYHDKLRDLAAQQKGQQDGTTLDHK